MTVPWKEEGADGDVTERLCIVGRDDEAILKAPGVMECSLDVVCRRSAKPFWNETELDDARSIGKASYPLLVISNSILAVTGVPGMFLYSKYNSRVERKWTNLIIYFLGSFGRKSRFSNCSRGTPIARRAVKVIFKEVIQAVKLGN